MGAILEEIRIGIGEWKIGREPQKLITLGLGSCVGVSFYDRILKIGGLAHVMLPDSSQFPQAPNPGKFADLALPLLYEAMKDLGAGKGSLQAKLAGGAQMFARGPQNGFLNIGERNVAACEEVLRRLGIPVVAADTGGHFGRTMILDTASGLVYIRTVNSPLKIL